jgi:hypothetical protein
MYEYRILYGCSGQVLSNQQTVSQFSLKTGAHASCGEILRQIERKILIERSGSPPANEILVAPGTARSYRELFEVERKEKLFGIGPPTPGVG